MARGVLLLVLLAVAHGQVVDSGPIQFEDGVLSGTCGLMALNGQYHWWFNDLHNQINHAAKLTILEYSAATAGSYDQAFFTGRTSSPRSAWGRWSLGSLRAAPV